VEAFTGRSAFLRQEESPTAEAPQFNTPVGLWFNLASGDRGGEAAEDNRAQLGESHIRFFAAAEPFCFAALHRKAKNISLRLLSAICLPR
jgi:hypothetical protein